MDGTRSRYLSVFALALALRLALMPATLHGDLIFTNYFPYFLSYQGVWDIYGYFGDHYLTLYRYNYYAPLVYYVTAFFQWVFKLIAPFTHFEGLMECVHSIFYNRPPSSLAEYLAPFTRERVMGLVFLMKLPYLIADLACLAILMKVFKESAARMKALALWGFHPLILFSIYIFGTYRIYTVFLFFLVFFFLRKNNRAAAALSYGCLLLSDNFPWFLLVPSVLVLGSGWKERGMLIFWMLVPFLGVFLPLYVSSHGYVASAYISPRFQDALSQSLTKSFHPREVMLVAKSGFILFYGLINAALFFSRRSRDWNMETRSALFISVNACILFVFYAANQTLIQYFLWIFPLFFIISVEGEPWAPALSWALIAALFIFNLDSRALNLGLFLPLDRAAMDHPSFHEWIGPFFPWGKVVAAARWIFSGLCIYFAWMLYRKKISTNL